MSSVYAQVRKLARELYATEAKIGAITECMYRHVFDAIDFDAIFRLEQTLWGLLSEVGIEDDVGDLADKIIRDAIVRAANDPDRNVSDVPFGITKAEAAAVAFDPGCPFCVLEAAEPPVSDANDHTDCDDCPLCQDMAREWRAENAQALARAGVGPRLPARSAPS